MTEQEIIQRYFQLPEGKGVIVGIGDDAACVVTDKKLVMSLDSLVLDQHFRKDDLPEDVGYKSLAVNLSDLAAMGSTPRWTMLSLSLPAGMDETWIKGFAKGFLALAKQWDVALIGGDLVCGPLTVTVQITGEINGAEPLLRSGACEDDGIYITGDIGDAGFAWHRADQLTADDPVTQRCLNRLHHPLPRIAEGRILTQFATAAIDISDGLLLDLSRLLAASQRGGMLELDKVPLGAGVSALLSAEDWLLPLTAGDDYELLFTMPVRYEADMYSAIKECGTRVTRIGCVTDEDGLRCSRDGIAVPLPAVLGFDHFGSSVS